jgi:hypothetical protein
MTTAIKATTIKANVAYQHQCDHSEISIKKNCFEKKKLKTIQMVN